MKNGIVPGVILAIMGLMLFAYEGMAISLRNGAANTSARTRQVQLQSAHIARTEGPNDQTFPAGPVLAGILFMSGVGLAAISANPVFQSQSENQNG